MKGGDHTNNICEGWNNGYMQLVGHHHPSFWKSIESIRKDEALNRISIINDQCGNPPRKKLRQIYVNLHKGYIGFVQIMQMVSKQWKNF